MKKYLLLLFVFCAFSCEQNSSSNRPKDQDVKTDGTEPSPTPTPMPEIKELAYPSCEELNQLWKTKYHKKLKIAWALKDIACDGPNLDRVFAEAAYILEATRFNIENLKAGMVTPPQDMLTFVTSKYRLLRIGKEGPPQTIVLTQTIEFYPSVAQENGFNVIGNLIHESRHADFPGHYHLLCSDGVNKGLKMCDNGLTESFNVGGSHSIASLYFAWAAVRSNWPAEWKSVFRQLALDTVNDRINVSEPVRQAWINKYLTDW